MADDDLERTVMEGTIDRDRANEFKATLAPILDAIPEEAMERLDENLYGFTWYNDYDKVNEAVHAIEPDLDPDLIAGGFYFDGKIHLAGGDSILYAHEIGHAIDGPDEAFTSRPEWEEAWQAERGPVETYENSNTSEWFCNIVATYLTDPVGWTELKNKTPRSAKLAERYLNERPK